MKRKTNILFLIDTILGIGGTEKHLSQLIRYLNKDKYSLNVVTFRCGNYIDSFHKSLDGHPYNFSCLSVKRIYGINALISAIKLIKLIKTFEIDLVHTFHFTSDTYGVLVAKLAGVSQIISSKRDMGDLKKRHHILLCKLVNPLVNRFLAVADAVAERYMKMEQIPRRKFTTIHNGIDFNKPVDKKAIEDIKNDLGLRKDNFIIGSVAHMRPEKGYEVFLKGVQNLKKNISGLKAVIAGYAFPKYRQMIKEMGLVDTVHLIGYTDKVNLYISLMDVACLIPVKNEGFSNAILEEMTFAKPVIATTVGGNEELVVDNETGILIPPNDTEAFEDAVMRLYNNRAILTQMGRSGRLRVEKEFTTEKMVTRMEEFYQDCLVQDKESRKISFN